MSSSLRAVLLDVMGTLLKLQPPAPLFCAALARSSGVQVPLELAEQAFAAEIRYYRKHHLEGRDERSLQGLHQRCAEVISAELGSQFAIGAEPIEAAMLESLRFMAYPDALPTLIQMRQMGLGLIAVSNWDISLPEALLGAGLQQMLDACISSAAIGAAKPSPDPFVAALKGAGLSATQAVHVGDSPIEDVQGARTAGIRAVLLLRQPAGGPLRSATSSGCAVIGSLLELPALLSSAAGAATAD